jgi:hypothetical protein
MNSSFINEGKNKYDEMPIPEDLELNLKRTLKKARNSKKHIRPGRIIGGFTAAALVFILLVNLSPNLAYALNSIPLIKHLVQLVNYDSYDPGFNNLVNSERFQEINLAVEDKGAKFTVTSIIGDDLKLWIGYDFQGEGLAIGQIKFKTKDGNKELPWTAKPFIDSKNYLDVQVDRLVKDFVMEIKVYKDSPLFKTPIVDLNEETLKNLREKFEQSQLTTLSIPISLNDKIYKQDLVSIDFKNKEYRSEIGILKFNKIQLSESRSIVSLELLSDEYELIRIEYPMLFDGQGNIVDYTSDLQGRAFNNKFNIMLDGGIKDYNSLTFKCSGIKYIAKKDKHITVDIKNKVLKPNNLGIELEKIEGNSVILNTKKGGVKFHTEVSSEKGKDTSIVGELIDQSNGTHVLEFKTLPDEKIILNVEEVSSFKTDGFELNLNN